MKHLTTLLLLASIAGLSSCMDDESSASRIEAVSIFNGYANTTGGIISFASYGDWTMTKRNSADWFNATMMSGKGGFYNTIPVELQPNTTGARRTASLHIQDNSEGKVYVDFDITQFATRGDGALGSCAFVRAITGSDGSNISFGYDSHGNVNNVIIEKGGVQLRSLSLTYKNDSTLAVTDGSSHISGKYDTGYQTQSGLKSETDTVGYLRQQLGSTSIMVSLQRHQYGGARSGISYLYNGQSGDIDGERQADSIKYFNTAAGDTTFIAMKPAYTNVSNRRQNIDANQLLLGVERTDPYALIGLFRLMRISKIIASATEDSKHYATAVQANADGSIASLAVTAPDGITTTYTFQYE